MVQHSEGRVELRGGEVAADALEQGQLALEDGVDRCLPGVREAHEVRTAMGGVVDQLDEPVGPCLVHHPLGVLAAELLGARELRHRAVPVAAKLVQDVAHPDGQTADLLVLLHEPGDAAIDRAEGDVDLGEAAGEIVRGEHFRHAANYDTLGVMIPAATHLDLPDQRISYRSSGTPGGPPLLLLHGGAVDSRMWGPQLDAFPERRVLAPDARGHGGSSDAEAPYRLVDDVIALMDALGIRRVVAAGVSMGGGSAVDLALEFPERVAAVVCSGTGTSEPEFTDPWALQAFADWRAAEQGTDAEAWIEVFQRFTAGPHRTREQVDPEVWELVEDMARDTLAQHLRLGSDGLPLPPVPPIPVTETWKRLGEITVPVLTVSGALDGDDHRAMGERLARSVGGPARHVEIPGAAHYPNLEAPDAFNDAVAELLDVL